MASKDSGIVNIHGKDYQTVAYRIKQFREKYPVEEGWGIMTNIIEANETVVRIQATIGQEKEDGELRLFASGHAEEYRADGKINKTSALENAETSAIGRALACFGLGGTEFASADEVARAISGQKPAAPAPLDENAVIKAMRGAKTLDQLDKYYKSAADRATPEQMATINTAFEVAREVLIESVAS